MIDAYFPYDQTKNVSFGLTKKLLCVINAIGDHACSLFDDKRKNWIFHSKLSLLIELLVLLFQILNSSGTCEMANPSNERGVHCKL